MKTHLLALALLALVGMAPMAHASTQTTSFNKTFTFNNLTITVSGTVTVDTTAKTVSGTITVSVVNDTSGQTIFSRTFSFVEPFSTGSDTLSVLAVPVFPTMLAVSCDTSTTTSPSTSCIVSKSPDLDLDGTVNIIDLVGIARNFGTTNTRADLNSDGIVNILDLAIVARDFGRTMIF